MAHQETAGQARARRAGDEEFLEDDIRRRVGEARDSVAEVVNEIKEATAETYHSVKEAVADFDWRDEVKKRPIALSLGALGVGLLTGFAVSAAIKRARGHDETRGYVPSVPHAYAAQPIVGEHHNSATEEAPAPTTVEAETKRAPAMVEKLKERCASDRVRQELGSLRDRFIDEISTVAHQVLLPALIRKIREALVSDERATRAQRPVPRRD